MIKPSRGYAFTILRPTSEKLAPIIEALKKDAIFFVLTLEKGRNSVHEHAQAYVYFRKKISYPKMRKLIRNSYCKAAQASPVQNWHYCLKTNEEYQSPILSSFGDLRKAQYSWEEDCFRTEESVWTKQGLCWDEMKEKAVELQEKLKATATAPTGGLRGGPRSGGPPSDTTV